MTEDVSLEKQKQQILISPRELLFKYLRIIPWVTISVAVFLLLAYVKLRYSTPVYNVTGKLLVKSSNPYDSRGEKFDDIFMMQGGRTNLNDEIEIIQSRYVSKRVAQKLGLQLQFQNKGKIRSSVVYHKDLPFIFDLVSVTDSMAGFGFQLKLLDNNKFSINESPQVYDYNQLVTTPGASFKVISNGTDWRVFASNIFTVSWQSIENAAANLSRSIKVVQASDFSNIISISNATENTRRGLDIVNQFMVEYQSVSLEDKRQIAVNTLDFINEQLDTVRYNLGSVERNLQNYREKNQVFNPEQQSLQYFGELSETNKLITEQEVKLKVADYLTNYIKDQRNPYRQVTSTLGIQDPALIQQITEFNRLQLERETSLQRIPKGNQIIKDLDVSIERLRNDIVENMNKVRQSYIVTINDLRSKNQIASGTIKSIPSKEKQLLEITRQQSILQELYSFLLQKKLETSIASASTISNIKVVESAMATDTPIEPNRKTTYIIALFFGLLIPIVILFLTEYLNDKVRSKSDVQQATQTPILGEIGHAENAGALVVTKNNRKILAEQFRIVRSNLQYILPNVEKPMLLVTSSFSGEGKSFISTNIGAVLALSGKKTVILEFDIRKPKILHGLGLKERKGITNFIVGNIDLNSIIHQVPDVENLFVIPCGPVPPNPAEMLLDDRIKLLFDQLREKFDAVIIDTAPVGLVSDAITLGAFASAAIYIVRHKYTMKKQLQLIQDIYVNKKLPHPSIIINDIDMKGGYGGYYGYGGYGYGGYGYGYGYGFGYFEEEKGKPSMMKRIKRLFKKK